jgi:hypothetical protein
VVWQTNTLGRQPARDPFASPTPICLKLPPPISKLQQGNVISDASISVPKSVGYEPAFHSTGTDSSSCLTTLNSRIYLLIGKSTSINVYTNLRNEKKTYQFGISRLDDVPSQVNLPPATHISPRRGWKKKIPDTRSYQEWSQPRVVCHASLTPQL